jgi:uncharacterized protein YggU (UPF0235/DUF167 family)
MTAAWQPVAGGVSVVVRLTPKGGRDAIDGVTQLADGRSVLKARVRAAPSEGEANLALCRLVAKSLGVAPRDVTLTAGASSRLKTLSVAGDAKMLIARLEKFVALG